MQFCPRTRTWLDCRSLTPSTLDPTPRLQHTQFALPPPLPAFPVSHDATAAVPPRLTLAAQHCWTTQVYYLDYLRFLGSGRGSGLLRTTVPYQCALPHCPAFTPSLFPTDSTFLLVVEPVRTICSVAGGRTRLGTRPPHAPPLTLHAFKAALV